jgi:phenylpyruvate tautomerase PptA (4-oxalocrotonate tautomerase family)
VPLVAIDVLEGHSQEELDAISSAVHEAMVEMLDVPMRDRFQLITQHTPETLRFDPEYLDIPRSESFVLVRVTLAAGRTDDAKRAFYRRLCDLLVERTDIPAEDLAVVLVENQRADWSFGRGQASYLELPREAWR